jgi:hypothetical protein
MIRSLILLLLAAPLLAGAQALQTKFPAGQGSKFKLNLKEGSDAVELAIYVASNRSKSVNVEYFIESKEGPVPIQMWQQFEIELKSNGPAEVVRGYIQTKELKKPETLTSEYLQGMKGGIQVNDFLFGSPDELNKIGSGKITTLAGETEATHYRTVSGGTTIDYWISEEAKPIGLVKLISKSDKDKTKDFSLELVTLMSNVKAKIEPIEAVPLTDVGKSFLAVGK